MSDVIRVMVVDDHALVRRSLGQLLSQSTDLQTVAECATGDEAITQALRHHPDVVVMDVDMPGVAAFDAARTILARSPGTRIVFLSAFSHDRYIEAALAAGAMGYLTKGESPESVARAVRAVARGKTAFSAEVQSRLVIDSEGVRLAPQVQSRVTALTDREVEVLRYVAQGLSKKEIAKVMHLSVKTVENHSWSMMKRLGIHDRVELTRFAIREGLVEA
ncbi:MAG: response regulator transcription factor [Planctomycetota bacterium]|nr:response regulator transcription factor [Planctomycetota bacterium]